MLTDEDLSRLLENVQLPLKTSALLRIFLNKINPIPKKEWEESKWYARAYSVFKVNVYFEGRES